jgi:PDZ domain
MKLKSEIGAAIAVALCAGMALRPASSAQTSGAPVQRPSATVRFAYAGNAAQLPAEFIENLILVPAQVNLGQPSLFQLDTTAAISSVDPKRAVELGIADTHNSVLNLSGVDILLPGFSQASSDDFGPRVGRSYEGTIGNDVFANVVVEIDYARQTVRIHDPAAYQYSGDGRSFPLTFHDGMPVVRAKFSTVRRKSVEAEFILNTALDASLAISDKFAQAHHLFSSHMKTIPVAPGELGVAGSAVLARLEDFQIGSYQVQGPLAAIAQATLPGDGDPLIAGEIGGGLLRRFAVVFDYSRRVVILSSNSEFHSEDREDMSGISVAAAGPGWKTLEVTQVRPGTPGADAGVQKGDVIAGVDDEAAADISLDAIRGLFRQVGHKYKLTIERNGKTLTINIQMRRLL